MLDDILPRNIHFLGCHIKLLGPPGNIRSLWMYYLSSGLCHAEYRFGTHAFGGVMMQSVQYCEVPSRRLNGRADLWGP